MNTTMAVTQQKKLRWFDRGAAAFERTFPGFLRSRLGADTPPMYVCPICDRAFTVDAVLRGDLTAEHVPPESFGGRELVLTCRWCNNTAGSRVDGPARVKEDLFDLMKGQSSKSLKVRVERDGLEVNAYLSRSVADGWKVFVPDTENNPTVYAAFKDKGVPTTSFRVHFVGNRYRESRAKMSWFRSGFLAMFAVAGYRFSLDPAVRIVKRQLRAPDENLIYVFTIAIPQASGWSDWKILDVPEPRCHAVVFGSYVVVFPLPGDLTFYERLEARSRSSEPGHVEQVTAPSYVLDGRGPSFGYDIEDESPPQHSVEGP